MIQIYEINCKNSNRWINSNAIWFNFMSTWGKYIIFTKTEKNYVIDSNKYDGVFSKTPIE